MVALHLHLNTILLNSSLLVLGNNYCSIFTTSIEKHQETDTLHQASAESGMAASITAESILGKEIHEDQMSDSTNTVVVEPIALSVKRFLSPYNGDDTSPQSTAIVMKNLTVEGSGTGVSNARSPSHIWR